MHSNFDFFERLMEIAASEPSKEHLSYNSEDDFLEFFMNSDADYNSVYKGSMVVYVDNDSGDVCGFGICGASKLLKGWKLVSDIH